MGVVARPEDSPRQRLLTGAKISEAFRIQGYSLVQYGGATVEYYTQGGYATGDVDMGFDGKTPSLEERNRVMQSLGSSPSLRLFMVDGVLVDLGGSAELLCRNFVEIETSEGRLVLESPEESIVQRVLMAVYPQENSEQRQAAKLLLAQALAGNIPVDWEELRRLADLPYFRVGEVVEILKKECQSDLK